MKKIMAFLLAAAMLLSLAACGKTENSGGESAGLQETESRASNAAQQKWNGWWYGGIDINGCTGGWEWINNTTYDAAMYVSLDENGDGSIVMYEYGQLFGPEIPEIFAELTCHADESCLYADSGISFGYEIEPSEWVFVPNRDNSDKINMGSSFTDEDNNRFGYDLTLMPWGSDWAGEESYTAFLSGFSDYLDCVASGQYGPFENESSNPASVTDGGAGGSGYDGSGNDQLLGSDPVVLDINNRGIVTVRYPGDKYEFDSDYGKINSTAGGASILFDPCLGSSNFEEYKAAFSGESYTSMDGYELYECTINGYNAIVCCGSDWLSARMNVVVDFGGEHDGFYGLGFTVSGDTLDDCQTDLVWAVINSFELIK